MTFLEAVNRVLRSSAIIKGDDDAVTSFSDIQHNASLNMAIIAIQDELDDLMSDRMIPIEKGFGQVTLVAGLRFYALDPLFNRFFGRAQFVSHAQNYIVPEYPGSREELQSDFPDFLADDPVASVTLTTGGTRYSGKPMFFYRGLLTLDEPNACFFPVPDSSVHGDLLAYEYEINRSVVSSGDLIPLYGQQNNAFCAMASRRFMAMFQEIADPTGFIENDPSYRSARSRLYSFLRNTNPARNYGVHYVS